MNKKTTNATVSLLTESLANISDEGNEMNALHLCVFAIFLLATSVRAKKTAKPTWGNITGSYHKTIVLDAWRSFQPRCKDDEYLVGHVSILFIHMPQGYDDQ